MSEDAHGGDDDERRRDSRERVVIRVRFRSVDDLVARYTSDVSKGGLFVSTPKLQPLGTIVDLALELPDSDEPAILQARVAYLVDLERARELGRAPGMGMAFVGDTTVIGERIASYLAASAGEDEAAPTRSLHVLVVDDSASSRASLERTLVEAGHRVTLAEQGLAALGAALKDPPDVILTDVNMPMMDGWQLVRVLRSRPATRETPVLFLTTLGSERDRIRGYAMGVDDFIEKPCEPHVLVARITRAVRRVDAERPADADGSALRGEVEQVSVASLLAFLEAERRSGELVVRDDRGGLTSVHVARGLVTRVDGPGAQPASLLERLFRALDLTTGHFEVQQLAPGAPAAAETSGTGIAIQQALLEHARRADEARKAR